MSLRNKLKCVLLAALIATPLFANEQEPLASDLNSDQNAAFFKFHKQQEQPQPKPVVIKKNYWTKMRCVQPKKYLFSQLNLGLGFLYFSNVQANLGLNPPITSSHTLTLGSFPNKGRLSYNRTFLYEYLLGAQISHGLKVALSFQEQQGIFISTNAQKPFGQVADAENLKSQFRSTLALNSVMAKLYLFLPPTFVWNKVAFSYFIAGGIGGSWQSWSNPEINFTSYIDGFSTYAIPFKSKPVASVAAMGDTGFRLKGKSQDFDFALTLGCKFIYWGQATNIGKLSQQGGLTKGLIRPLGIETIYSFTPYLGFEWIFPVSGDYMINGKCIHSNEVIWAPIKQVDYARNVITQLNIGPNFLYFSGLSGNLSVEPRTVYSRVLGNSPLKGKIHYLKAPLYEYLVGCKPLNWLKYALSFQWQQNTVLQTPYIPSLNSTNSTSKTQFTTYLNLYGLMAKFYLETPNVPILKSIAMMPYIGFGAGASWQSYIDISQMMFDNSNFVPVQYVSKYFASALWGVDAGLSFKNARPCSMFSFQLGCKYNQWGQMRSLGQPQDQAETSVGLFKPLKAQILYSFTPYVGLQWNFPLAFNYCIKNKHVNTFKAYFTWIGNVQDRSVVFTQMNIGAGFLFFDKVRGSIGLSPALQDAVGAATVKRPLEKNLTPLFEYLIGYRPTNWLKLALSMQSQTGLFITTGPVASSNSLSPTITNTYHQLKSHVELYSLLFKVYFEVPYAFIMKGWATSFYISPAIGASWQTWTDVTDLLNGVMNGNLGSGSETFLNQKIMNNVCFMADVGFKLKNAPDFSNFAIVYGCKFINWGQCKNLGDISEQSNWQRIGIFKPFSIRMIYSFAPYIGFQWSF